VGPWLSGISISKLLTGGIVPGEDGSDEQWLAH
jgi:hypothetical protein